jgi:hypothetical protein
MTTATVGAASRSLDPTTATVGAASRSLDPVAGDRAAAGVSNSLFRWQETLLNLNSLGDVGKRVDLSALLLLIPGSLGRPGHPLLFLLLICGSACAAIAVRDG